MSKFQEMIYIENIIDLNKLYTYILIFLFFIARYIDVPMVYSNSRDINTSMTLLPYIDSIILFLIILKLIL